MNWLSSNNSFLEGGAEEAKSIVMLVSIVLLIFLSISNQVLGGQNASGGSPLPPVNESQLKTRETLWQTKVKGFIPSKSNKKSPALCH